MQKSQNIHSQQQDEYLLVVVYVEWLSRWKVGLVGVLDGCV